MRTLGLDLGGTKVLAVILDERGEVLATRREATVGGGVEAVLDQLERMSRELQAAAGPVAAVGLGFPGLVEPGRGVARSSVILTGWKEVELGRHLAERLGVPVQVDNDVNQAARAELAARPEDPDFLFVTVGTGVGGAVVLGGELWGGAGHLAGEVGHVSIDRHGPPCACGRRGCLGALASGGAIEDRLGRERGSLAAAWAAGDPEICVAVDEAAEALGHGLASVMNVMSFPCIVLGGGLAHLGEGYHERVWAAARREAFEEIAAHTRFELTRRGYDAGAIGAALHARSRRTPV